MTFTEKEIRLLVFDCLPNWECVFTEEGDSHRWTREMFTVVQNMTTGETLGVNWSSALTENQEHEFYEQPYPVELYEEVIPEQRVAKWRRVKTHSFGEDSDCTMCGAFGPNTVSGESCPGEVKK